MLANRTIFQDVQASTRLPPPSEHQAERSRDTSLLCDHRLHLDLALHRSKPNQANLRDDLLLHERMGKPWGVGGTHRKNETLVFLGALRFKRTESVRCCAVGKPPSKILLIQLIAFAIESVPLALRQSTPRHIGSSNANGNYRAEQ